MGARGGLFGRYCRRGVVGRGKAQLGRLSGRRRLALTGERRRRRRAGAFAEGGGQSRAGCCWRRAACCVLRAASAGSASEDGCRPTLPRWVVGWRALLGSDVGAVSTIVWARLRPASW
jgi:hypothetical protein